MTTETLGYSFSIQLGSKLWQAGIVRDILLPASPSMDTVLNPMSEKAALRGWARSTLQRYNTKKSKQVFPKKELRGHSPNSYIHVSVSDLYIPTIGLPILLQENKWTDCGIYRSLNVEIGTEAAQFFFWKYINQNFFWQCTNKLTLLNISHLRTIEGLLKITEQRPQVIWSIFPSFGHFLYRLPISHRLPNSTKSLFYTGAAQSPSWHDK